MREGLLSLWPAGPALSLCGARASLQWLLWPQGTGSRAPGRQLRLRHVDSAVAARALEHGPAVAVCGLACSVACGSSHQGLKPCLLPWQVDSAPPELPGWRSCREPAAKAGDTRDVGSIPGWEDPLEKEMASCSILAWEILWTGDPGRLQSTGSQRVRPD